MFLNVLSGLIKILPRERICFKPNGCKPSLLFYGRNQSIEEEIINVVCILNLFQWLLFIHLDLDDGSFPSEIVSLEMPIFSEIIRQAN